MNFALAVTLIKFGLMMLLLVVTAITESFDYIRWFLGACFKELRSIKFPKLFSFKGQH
jgi:hypothetical protein